MSGRRFFVPSDDRKLVHGQELVVRQIIEVHQPRTLVALQTISVEIRDRDAREQQLMKATVILDEYWRGAGERAINDELDGIP